MIELGHLRELRCRTRHRGHDGGDDPQPGSSPREPHSARAEVQTHERQDRHDDKDDGHLRQAHGVKVFRRRLRAHDDQLEHRETCDGHREHGEQHVGVLGALPVPDDEMQQCERQAGRSHHRPGDVDPVHLERPLIP